MTTPKNIHQRALYFVARNGAGGFVGEGLSAFLTVRYLRVTHR